METAWEISESQTEEESTVEVESQVESQVKEKMEGRAEVKSEEPAEVLEIVGIIGLLHLMSVQGNNEYRWFDVSKKMGISQCWRWWQGYSDHTFFTVVRSGKHIIRLINKKDN